MNVDDAIDVSLIVDADDDSEEFRRTHRTECWNTSLHST